MSINTNQLKKFAQNTRKKLLQQVGARLDYILSVDSAEMRDVADIVKRLQQDIDRTSREEVIDQVAYTWFNRLTALRYMDLHDYQPLGLRIISGRDGSGEAEIYQAALRHQLPAELEVDRERISQLITGHIASRNPHNEIMRMLLVAACQNLSKIMPFLFERINGYTELLLPEDLLSDQSILADFRKGMTEANAREVEVIGWLYQFYISEKKDAVFASKGKVSKEEIPAATQLFTPRWIVEYMVQNTIGKLWVINNPNSRLREHMPYYIESEVSQEDILAIHSPEELTLLDQACGSGHILVYGFELLHRIYEEAGHAPSEIPGLIIRHNLRGFEIDPRAAQLAALAITLKAREYQRRYFRKSEVPAPHITCFQDLTLSDDEITDTLHALQADPSEDLIYDLKLMQQSAQFGSLILPRTSIGELELLNTRCEQVLQSNDLFLINRVERLKYALTTLLQLSQKYACVVDNPPYMGSGNMNKELSGFVKTKYPESKADLMACFMEAGLVSLQEKGLLGMINQHSWMFLSSYEKLRIKLIEHSFVDTLLHLGPRTFPEIGGEVVQNAAFTILNDRLDKKGHYVRLVDFGDSELKRTKTLEAIQNPDCGWFYTANQKDFEKIPGSPVGYWVLPQVIEAFSQELIGDNHSVREGVGTRNDDRFIRFCWEIESKLIGKEKKWLRTDKAGGGYKWYNEYIHVLNWENEGSEIRNYRNPDGSLKSRPQNTQFFYQEAISWGKVSSGSRMFRFREINFGFNDAAPSIFGDNLYYILGLLNSKISDKVLEIKGGTLNLTVGIIKEVPLVFDNVHFISEMVGRCINITKEYWFSQEHILEFKTNGLLQGRFQNIKEAYISHCQYWTKLFFNFHQKEEDLNWQFINIYGLEDELTPEVPLDEITILQEELDRKKLTALDKQWTKVGRTMEARPSLPFKDQEVMAQLVSYAVGCMFGRYSLDKEGLILANQGEDLTDFVRKVVDGEGVVDGGRLMVDGEGVVDGGRLMVDGEGEGVGVGESESESESESGSEGEGEKNRDYDTGLQGTEDMAAEPKAGQIHLFDDEADASGGIIQPDGSDQKGGGEHSKQYSRRASKGQEGISPLPADNSGLSVGTGNTASSDGGSGDASGNGDSTTAGGDHKYQEANPQSDGQTPLKHTTHPTPDTPTSNHHSPSTSHYPPMANHHPLKFMPDDDAIIPVMDEKWFDDDIVSRFREFIRVAFGEDHFRENMNFLTQKLGSDIRRYFVREFYNDHIKRYKKRPIYWMLSSPEGHFRVLIYMHRYTPDTLSIVLNKYLNPLIEMLETQKVRQQHIAESGGDRERRQAEKEVQRLDKMIQDCKNYRQDTLYPLALKRIAIDLDDGVLVNYNKFGKVVAEVKGLNDKKAKAKVRKFDWIDTSEII